MPIDPTKPVQGQTAIKGDLRSNLQAAQDGVHLDPDTETAAFTVDGTLFGDHKYLRRYCDFSGDADVTLGADDVAVHHIVELVRKGAGNITAIAGTGVTLLPAAETGNWPAGLHSTTDLNEAMLYGCDEVGTQIVHPTADGAASTDDTGTSALATSLTFAHTIGGGSNRLLAVWVTAENAATGPTISGVTYNGIPMRQVGTGFNESARTYAHLFVMLEASGGAQTSPMPAAGTYDVVVSTAGGSMLIVATAKSYHGANQQVPTIFDGADLATGTTISVTLNAVPQGSIVIDAVAGSQNVASLNSDEAEDTELHFATFTTPEDHSSNAGEFAVNAAGNVARAWTWASSQSRRVIIAAAIEGIEGPTATWRQISRPPVAAA